MPSLLQSMRGNKTTTSYKSTNSSSKSSVIAALRKCDVLASKTAKLCNKETSEESEFLSGGAEGLRDLGDTTSPTAFHMIQRVTDDDSIESAIAKCQRMRASAEEIAQQSAKTMASLSKAIAVGSPSTDSSAPVSEEESEGREGAEGEQDRTETKRALFSDSDDTLDAYDTDEDAVVERNEGLDMSFLQQVDTDIDQLEDATERANSELDLFTASSLGSSILELASGKGQFCVELFQKMYNLSDNLQNVSRSVMQGAGCCSQMRALAGGMAGLVQAQQLVQVLLQTSDAALRLVNAITALIEQSWGKIQSFVSQFMAAKTLGRFTGSIQAKKAASIDTDDQSLTSEGFNYLLDRFTCNPCPSTK